MMDGEAIHEGVNEAAPTEPLSWKQAYVNDDGTEDEEEEGDEVDDPEDAVEVKEEDEDDVVDEAIDEEINGVERIPPRENQDEDQAEESPALQPVVMDPLVAVSRPVAPLSDPNEATPDTELKMSNLKTKKRIHWRQRDGSIRGRNGGVGKDPAPGGLNA